MLEVGRISGGLARLSDALIGAATRRRARRRRVSVTHGQIAYLINVSYIVLYAINPTFLFQQAEMPRAFSDRRRAHRFFANIDLWVTF